MSVRAYRDSDNDEIRAAVFIGGVRMASVPHTQKAMIGKYMPCEIRVNNIHMLQATFKSVKHNGRVMPSRVLSLDTTFMSTLRKKAPAAHLPALTTEVLDQIDTSAAYWEQDVDARDLGLVGLSVKQTAHIKLNEVCAEVVLTNAKGATKTVEIMAVPGKQFAIVDDAFGKRVSACILQLVHHELYRMVIERQQAN
jgi:hypothetical protein